MLIEILTKNFLPQSIGECAILDYNNLRCCVVVIRFLGILNLKCHNLNGISPSNVRSLFCSFAGLLGHQAPFLGYSLVAQIMKKTALFKGGDDNAERIVLFIIFC